MNYTKEKWERDGNCIYALNKNGTNRFYVSVQRGKDDGDVTIAGEEADTNVNLISAAPGMYETLKYAAELIKVAIAKAEGRAK